MLRPLRIAATLSFFALAGLEGKPQGQGLHTMNYEAYETVYGPEIRFFDWRVTEGNLASDHNFRETRGVWQPGGEGVNGLFFAGGTLQAFTTTRATVTRSDQIFGSGGDVEIRAVLALERLGENGLVRIRFHDARAGTGGSGVSVRLDQSGVAVLLRETEVARADLEPLLGGEIELRLATLAHQFSITLNGNKLYVGEMEASAQDNEGWTHIDLVDAGVRLIEFEESLIRADRDYSTWRKAELLYRESFGPDSLRDNWVVNGVTPQVLDGGYVFRPMSNVVLHRRFEGPLAIELDATPMPTDEFSAGLTDAIFIWMMDHPEESLPEFMRRLPNADRTHYLPLPFYWMDFGGTNNVTTRFRRSPGLRMVRQFSDRERLLERDRTYRITLVQNGHEVEFWVDGERWIQVWDPAPHQTGYVGTRSFNSQLRLSRLDVWRIE
jgi:hypothetical protein